MNNDLIKKFTLYTTAKYNGKYVGVKYAGMSGSHHMFRYWFTAQGWLNTHLCNANQLTDFCI